MDWDRPNRRSSRTGRESGILAANYEPPPRPDSEVILPTYEVEMPKWAFAMRNLALFLPSSWVLLTACLWWAWRLVALVSRGDFELSGSTAPPLLRGMFADVLFLMLFFALVRVGTLIASPSCDQRVQMSRVLRWIAFGVLSLSTLTRIGDVVHCSVEKTAPNALFWHNFVATPLDFLLNGGMIAGVGIALAAAAIARYAITIDLEATERTIDLLGRPRVMALSVSSLLAATALCLGVTVGATRLPIGSNDWSRLPELQAVSGLRAAIAEKKTPPVLPIP